MAFSADELERLLRILSAAVRITEDGTADFEPGTKAANAVFAILEGHSGLLKTALEGRRSAYRNTTAGRLLTNQKLPERMKDFEGFAFLYAVSPPAAENMKKASRKGKLRLQEWLIWLNTGGDVGHFAKLFQKWANICATEYFRSLNRAGVVGHGPDWVPLGPQSVSPHDEEGCEIPVLPDEPDEQEEEDQAQVPTEQIARNLIQGMRERLNNNDQAKRLLAAMVVLRYSPSFALLGAEYPELRHKALEMCESLSRRTMQEIETEFEKLTKAQQQRTDLKRRRKAGDLPLISYDDLLPLFGINATKQERSRFYTQVSRLTKSLRAERDRFIAAYKNNHR